MIPNSNRNPSSSDMGRFNGYNNCEYVREYYGVPACIGRRITFTSKSKGVRTGIIAEDRGHYIGVNFDEDKPGVVYNMHPREEGLEYGEMGKIRKMTRSQMRYQAYAEFSECYDSFADYLGIKDKKEKEWEKRFKLYS